jgi:16S rRNA (guanine(966)-N(2))-methyltransferase RsmD
VIAGSAKGRKLRSVPGDATRPISDRVKESLFNILGGDICGASLLDLYAGTGSVGIEALSRGAAFVRFVEWQRRAVDIIRANLQLTGLAERAEVLRKDVFVLLRQPPDRAFDYVYIAPPQYHGLWRRTLEELDGSLGWLSEDAWVIVQIHPNEYQPLELKHLVEREQRRYGSTLLVIYARQSMLDQNEEAK